MCSSRRLPVLVFLMMFFLISVDSAYANKSFKQKGYLKDAAKNRVFTVLMMRDVSKSEVLYFASRKPNTVGQLTAVYFYEPGSIMPVDGITFAKTVFEANSILYDTEGLSAWRYVFMKYLNGNEVLVDCVADSDNDLCR